MGLDARCLYWNRFQDDLKKLLANWCRCGVGSAPLRNWWALPTLPLPLMVFREFANGIMKSNQIQKKIKSPNRLWMYGLWEDRNNNAISAPLADQYEVTNRKHFQFPPQLLPSQPTAENFVQVWQTTPLVSTCSTVPLLRFHVYFESAVLCFSCLPTSQVVSGAWLIFTVIVSTIMIPFQIIPLYILTVQLGIRNTYIGDFSGDCFCLCIFLLRQAFQGVLKK